MKSKVYLMLAITFLLLTGICFSLVFMNAFVTADTSAESESVSTTAVTMYHREAYTESTRQTTNDPTLPTKEKSTSKEAVTEKETSTTIETNSSKKGSEKSSQTEAVATSSGNRENEPNEGNVITFYQQDNIENNENNNPTVADNVKLNYSSLSLQKGNTFSLVLINADSSVKWKISNSKKVKIYQDNGNQCTFQALEKGSAVITASYKNRNYTCEITIK